MVYAFYFIYLFIFFPHEQDTIYTPGIDKGGRVELFLLQSMSFKLLVSYDAVNLYPSVPIQKAISAIMEIITYDADDFKTRTKLSLSDVQTLIELCLKKCYFT